MAYNPRNPIKQTSQSQSTLLEVRVNCTFDQTFFFSILEAMFSSCCGWLASYLPLERRWWFHDVADGIFAHSNFGVPDIIWLRTIYTLRHSGLLSFIPSGLLDNQSLKRCTWLVFPPLVEYIACSVVLRNIVRPPLRVLVTFLELYNFPVLFLLSYDEVLYISISTPGDL